MTKSGLRPAAAASRRSRRTQRLWKVEIQLLRGAPGRRAPIRAFISPAALLVKVTARTASEGTPFSRMRWAMRCVMTRVLPLPAPARMRTGPSVASTASRCCGLSPARSLESSDTISINRATASRLAVVRGGRGLRLRRPVGLHDLPRAAEGQGPRGHVFGNHAARPHVGAFAYGDRCDQRRIAAHEGAALDAGGMLRPAVVIAGNG